MKIDNNEGASRSDMANLNDSLLYSDYNINMKLYFLSLIQFTIKSITESTILQR